jgi:predicted Rossmann-fold nucleotide-binding protein
MRNTLLEQRFISEEDLKLLRVCDTVDEVVDAVRIWHHKRELGGKKAMER